MRRLSEPRASKKAGRDRAGGRWIPGQGGAQTGSPLPNGTGASAALTRWMKALKTMWVRSAKVLLAAFLAAGLAACRLEGAPPTPTARPLEELTPTLTDPTITSEPGPPGTPSPSPPCDETPTRPDTPSPHGIHVEQALAPGFRDQADQFPDATRYRLDLVLDVEQATLSGDQHIIYTNTESVDLTSIYLRLFPNTSGYGGRMSVASVEVDGQRVSPEGDLEGSVLRVPLPSPLQPGTHVGLGLRFELALPTDTHPASSQEPSDGYRQLGLYEGVAALANAYAVIPVYDDEGWNLELAPSYGDAVFTDVAFFDVRLTAPSSMQLVASGTCVPAEEEASTTTWFCAAAPMRDFNAVLGTTYETTSQEVKGITVNSVFYAGHEEGGQAALDFASRALELFSGRIGAYPFAELDVVETPTMAGGIEYPGLVVINQSYYDSGQRVSDRMEWVVVHEVLHQWWYSLVGNDQVDEPWLDEALVQYCTALYYEEVYGTEALDIVVETSFQQAYAELQETGRDRPVGLPVSAYSRRDYAPVVYQKGPLYFHDLRQEVGEEAFWEILETYFDRNRHRIARPDDWLAAVEAVTGSEYRSLYKEWILSEGD